MKWMLLLGVALALCACEREQPAPKPATAKAPAPASVAASPRWYTPEQVASGAGLYAQHCASCHKANAEGTSDWKSRDSRGKLPPPPLNGTAHTWHHPLDVLRAVVRRGGVPLGGSMPAFADKLSSDEIDAILAWIQTHWPERTYAMWYEGDLAASTGKRTTR